MSRERIRLIALSAAFLASLLSMQFLPELSRPLDQTMDDWRTRAAIALFNWNKKPQNKEDREHRVVIIDIDERSVAEQGAWPWPREKLANLLKILLDNYKVSGIALDVVFPESKSNDVILAQQMQRTEITGAVVYDLQQRNLPQISQSLPSLIPIYLDTHFQFQKGVPVTSNDQLIMPTRVGHITPLFDRDGSIRKLPPLICNSRENLTCMPLLEIAAFSGLLDQPQISIKRGNGLLSPPQEMLIQSHGETIVKVPLNQDGSLTIPYRHNRKDWYAISATDILNERLSSNAIKGSVALVGSTALGMSDVISTPVNPVASGIEPHAEVMVALFDGNFLYTPQYALFFVGCILLVYAGSLRFAMNYFRSPIAMTLIYPIWLIIVWSISALVILVSHLWMNILWPISPFFIFPLLTISVCSLLELYDSSRGRISVVSILSTYLPKQIANRLVFNEKYTLKNDHDIDASRRQITVLFADLRGFTSLVESHKPEVIAKLMHRFFSEMAESIVEHQGTIDKFIGDSVMAFWNAPDADINHAQNAYLSAQDMQKRIDGMKEFCIDLGIKPIVIGIGIETGLALVGNFGSSHRRTYTALGETVVLASRIEGLTAKYQQTILIGESCAHVIGVEQFLCLGESAVRGRHKNINLYAPMKM